MTVMQMVDEAGSGTGTQMPPRGLGTAGGVVGASDRGAADGGRPSDTAASSSLDRSMPARSDSGDELASISLRRPAALALLRLARIR